MTSISFLNRETFPSIHPRLLGWQWYIAASVLWECVAG
jgi:hypothetical protein